MFTVPVVAFYLGGKVSFLMLGRRSKRLNLTLLWTQRYQYIAKEITSALCGTLDGKYVF